MSSRYSPKYYQFVFNNDSIAAVYEIKGGYVERESIDSDETYIRDGNNVLKIEFEDGRQEVTTYTDADGDGYFLKAGKVYLPTNTSSFTSFHRDHAYDEHDEYDSHDFDHDFEPNHTEFAQERHADDAMPVFTNTGSRTGGDIRISQGDLLDQYRFVLSDGSLADGDLVDANENVAAQYELGRRGWKQDFLDRNETIDIQELANAAFIVKTEIERNGSAEFSIYSDVNGDGTWHEILEGYTTAAYVAEGSVDLVGLADAGLLEPAVLGL